MHGFVVVRIDSRFVRTNKSSWREQIGEFISIDGMMVVLSEEIHQLRFDERDGGHFTVVARVGEAANDAISCKLQVTDELFMGHQITELRDPISVEELLSLLQHERWDHPADQICFRQKFVSGAAQLHHSA